MLRPSLVRLSIDLSACLPFACRTTAESVFALLDQDCGQLERLAAPLVQRGDGHAASSRQVRRQTRGSSLQVLDVRPSPPSGPYVRGRKSIEGIFGGMDGCYHQVSHVLSCSFRLRTLLSGATGAEAVSSTTSYSTAMAANLGVLR